MNPISMLFARRVMSFSYRFADIPEKLKPEVKAILEEYGLGYLAEPEEVNTNG